MGVFTVIATAYSIYQQEEARGDARKARRTERRIREAENLQERKKSIRAQRIQAAQIMNAAAQTGTAQSSGVAGGVGSLQTQTAANIGLQQQLTALNDQRLSFLSSAEERQAKSSTSGTMASFVGNNLGGYDEIQSWFN